MKNIQKHRLSCQITKDLNRTGTVLSLNEGLSSNRRSLQSRKRTSSDSNHEICSHFSFLVGHFALLDPDTDPLTLLNSQQIAEENNRNTVSHGLINYMDTKAKCRHFYESYLSTLFPIFEKNYTCLKMWFTYRGSSCSSDQVLACC
jgi:hypothetical protein